MRRVIALLALVLSPSLLPSQTAKDSAHVRLQLKRLDSVRVAMDSLRRWCRVQSYQSPKYLRRSCAIALASPDARLRWAEDSLLLPVVQPTPVPVPVPIPPADTVIQPPPSSGIAELPRSVPPSRDPYPGKLCSVTVPDGLTIAADLSSAFAAARGGQVVCFMGTHTKPRLPARAVGDTGTIVVRSVGLALPEGMRATPSNAAQFATIRTTDTECAIATTPGTYGWYLAGIRFTSTASTANNPATYNIVCLGAHSTEQDVMAEVPQRIVLSRVVVDGGSLGIQNCIALNSGTTAIVDSWIQNCHLKGFEGHAIASYNGPGPFLIENNFIEGAGINVLIGGSTPRIANLRGADITIRRNHFYKPLSWGPPGTGLGAWAEKNLLEFKNAARVLVEGNYFENSWQDAQPTGSGIMIKSINDEGICGWCQTTDVTVRRNYGTNIETPIVISAAENYNDPTKPPLPVTRVLISENVFDNIGAVAWGAKGIQLTPGHSLTGAVDVTIERNVTAQAEGRTVAHGVMVFPRGERIVFRDNVFSHGVYPVLDGEGHYGSPVLPAGTVWSGMTLVKLANHTGGTAVPTGTTIVTSESAAPLSGQIRSVVNAAIQGVVVPP